MTDAKKCTSLQAFIDGIFTELETEAGTVPLIGPTVAAELAKAREEFDSIFASPNCARSLTSGPVQTMVDQVFDMVLAATASRPFVNYAVTFAKSMVDAWFVVHPMATLANPKA